MPSPCASSALLGPFRFDTSRCGEVAHNACQRSDDTGMDMFTSTRASSVTGSLICFVYLQNYTTTNAIEVHRAIFERSLAEVRVEHHLAYRAQHAVLNIPIAHLYAMAADPSAQSRQLLRLRHGSPAAKWINDDLLVPFNTAL